MNCETKCMSILCVFLIGLSISGCATAPLTSDEEEALAERFEPAPVLGNLYIVRKTTFVGSAIDISVKIDEQFIGIIQPGSYHFLELPPGEYTISAQTNGTVGKKVIDIVAGKNHFLQAEPPIMFKTEVQVERLGDEEGRKLVGAGSRLVTQQIRQTLLLTVPTLEDVLDASAADLAVSYMSMKPIVRHVSAGAKATLNIGGVTISEDNVDVYKQRLEKRLSVYEQAIRQRGFVDLSGMYKGEATEACSRSNAFLAALIQAQMQESVEIRQNDMDALVVISVKHDDGERELSNPAAVVESAIVVNEAANSDYYFRGDFNNDVIVIKPDVSVLRTWPKWANPPSLRDLEECSVTLKRI
jgi:hypothetical protein